MKTTANVNEKAQASAVGVSFKGHYENLKSEEILINGLKQRRLTLNFVLRLEADFSGEDELTMDFVYECSGHVVLETNPIHTCPDPNGTCFPTSGWMYEVHNETPSHKALPPYFSVSVRDFTRNDSEEAEFVMGGIVVVVADYIEGGEPEIKQVIQNIRFNNELISEDIPVEVILPECLDTICG